MPLYRIEESNVEEVYPGDYTLQMFNVVGDLIYETKFVITNSIISYTDSSIATDIDIGMFAFAVPYLEDVQGLQILLNDLVIKDINVTAQLLHDGIDAIPQAGFVNEVDQKRSALHAEINEIETSIKDGELLKAANALKFNLMPKIDVWLVDNYQTENALDYSKQEVLDLVDDLAARLVNEIFLPFVALK